MGPATPLKAGRVDEEEVPRFAAGPTLVVVRQ